MAAIMVYRPVELAGGSEQMVDRDIKLFSYGLDPGSIVELATYSK